ncbi:hypothetical protein NDN08_004408 [Rhodosorus marinus]|uniref:Uncharacterized protein n=1 Tax=Rhodosorus marinus TaxID=101924 RepID=A0AAV8ULL9_9RHOD|nr:hypothetical protein NDN08_004408 [Rhodosorus marinus]
MTISGFTVLAWIALIGSVLASARFDVNLRVDFGTTLKTGGVETFSRRQFINGHGTFKVDTKVVSQDMLDYIVDDLHVSFSRSAKGPFRHDDYPSRTAKDQVQEDGGKSLKDKECSKCAYQEELSHMSELRVLTDDPFELPEITKSKSTQSTAVSYAGYYFRYYFDNKS